MRVLDAELLSHIAWLGKYRGEAATSLMIKAAIS